MSRRQTFRPRPLKISQQIPIYWTEAEILENLDVKGNGIRVLSDYAPDDASTDTTTEDKDSGKKRKHIDIPTPVIGIVPTYAAEHTQKVLKPNHFIRWIKDTQFDYEQNRQYEYQYEDDKWLASHSRWGSSGTYTGQLTCQLLESIIDTLEKLHPVHLPGNHRDEKDLYKIITEKHNVNTRDNSKCIHDIISYWMSKRNKLGKPVLRKYWPQTAITDSDPHKVFRPREKERYKLRRHRKNDHEALSRLKQLKEDSIQLQKLFKAIEKREKLKKHMVSVSTEIFEQSLFDLTHIHGPPRQIKIEIKEKHSRIRLKVKLRVQQDTMGMDGENLSHMNLSSSSRGGHLKKNKKSKHKNKKKSIDGMEIEGDGGFYGGRDNGYYNDGASYSKSNASPWFNNEGDGVEPPPLYLTEEMNEIQIPSFLDLTTGDDDYKTISRGLYEVPFPDIPCYSNMNGEDSNNMLSDKYESSFMNSSPTSAQLLPRFRTRGRIGRGGRYIIDRVPIKRQKHRGGLYRSLRTTKKMEIYAAPWAMESYIKKIEMRKNSSSSNSGAGGDSIVTGGGSGGVNQKQGARNDRMEVELSASITNIPPKTYNNNHTKNVPLEVVAGGGLYIPSQKLARIYEPKTNSNSSSTTSTDTKSSPFEFKVNLVENKTPYGEPAHTGDVNMNTLDMCFTF